jgi:hypothetical protein
MDADGNAMSGSPINEREIGERISLIESMMREGRRRTEYWGWNFLLWGVAYLVAMAWSSFLQTGRMLAWPVTMITAVVLTIVIARKRMRHEPKTERSRALGSIWMAMGWGIFAFAFPAAYSGHFEPHSFMAAIEAMLGIGHVASGSTLRWPVQISVGAIWWVAAIVTCFVPNNNDVAYIFLAAVLVCNIGFGTYLMIRESRDKARARGGEVQHA